MKVKKGDRVTLSEMSKGRMRQRQDCSVFATVLRRQRKGSGLVRVLWDGTKNPTYIHEDHLQKI